MPRRSLLLLTLLVPGLAVAETVPEPAAPDRRMAITVDDLPVAPPSAHTLGERERITPDLLAVLERYRVPAIGFVNEGRLEIEGRVEPRLVALLERWLAAGFELGNHSYDHLDLHRVDAERWMADVARGERVLTDLLATRGARPRFFRHPFLHTGRSLEVKERTEGFLSERGYRVAPVTIDNQEWIFGRAYVDAGGDEKERARIGAAYVDYMEAMTEYYEDQSRVILGEEIPQVLLIHAYALNAAWLDELLERLVDRGYRFVPLEEALEHPAFALPDRYVGPGGITWLHRWAITRGMPGSTFRGEPGLPDWLPR